MVGIYMIENKVNGKKYVGQSWDIEKRWANHKLGQHNEYLESAMKKYGLDNFEFRILCELFGDEQNQSRLDDLEAAYIDILDTTKQSKGYNLKAGGAHGKHSPITIAKISASKTGKHQSEESKKKISEGLKGRQSPMKGRSWSEDTRNIMREKLTGKKHRLPSKPRSEESKKKTSAKLKGRPSPMKGRHQSEEAKEKVRLALTGKKKNKKQMLISEDQ